MDMNLGAGRCRWEQPYRAEGNKEGKWDDCNSIINKIYFKMAKKKSVKESQYQNFGYTVTQKNLKVIIYK